MAKGGWREFDSTERPARPAPPAAAVKSRAERQVRVQRSRAGRGGKMVTTITGLELDGEEARAMLKVLKAGAGTGGTLKAGVIELQGDQVAAAMEALRREGFRPKQAGG